jgi:Phage integrase family
MPDWRVFPRIYGDWHVIESAIASAPNSAGQMMIAEECLARSRPFRRLNSGPHGQLIERYAARLIKDGLNRQGTLRSLRLVGDLFSWTGGTRCKLIDLDERMVERFLCRRAKKQSIQWGDRAAVKRLLSVLRDTGTILPVEPPQITPQGQILADFSDYLQRERGLALASIIRCLPTIRRFVCEVCPAGANALGRIKDADVVRYVERHARDGSAMSGKAMCWSLRAFLRYLHHNGLNPVSLARCVPRIRQWKLANLPTYLSPEQVQKVLDGCDRTSVIGRRDYAILMMLAKLGLRANEVATLTLNDIDWRSGKMRVCAKGRQRVPDANPSRCRHCHCRLLALCSP